jgi:hypothetical protein
MRTSYVLIVSAAAAWATMVACSSGPGTGSTTGDSTGTNIQSELIGTWTDSTYTTDGAPFQGVTLNSDGSFSWTAPCVSQGVESCHSVRTDSGNWSVGMSGPELGASAGAPQLQLVDQFSQKTNYFLQVSPGTMILSTQITLGAQYTFTSVASNASDGGADSNQPFDTDGGSGDVDGGSGDSGSGETDGGAGFGDDGGSD